MTTREEFKARLTARATDLARQACEAEGVFVPDHGPDIYSAASGIEAWADRVPCMWWDADLAALTPAQRSDKIRRYIADRQRNLLLAGPVGTGKSYAAWAVAHEFVAYGLRVRAWSVPRLLLDMRPDGDPGAFRTACVTPVLLLDDLGAARPTDWATEQLYSIVEERCSNRLRTIITTNSPYQQLVALWGEPTMDRLRDKAVDVEIKGPSRRGAA